MCERERERARKKEREKEIRLNNGVTGFQAQNIDFRVILSILLNKCSFD